MDTPFTCALVLLAETVPDRFAERLDWINVSDVITVVLDVLAVATSPLALAVELICCVTGSVTVNAVFPPDRDSVKAGVV